MNILLTGSGGFVGKNLKEYFKDFHNLLTPRSFELNLCDKVSVDEYFSKNNIDYIIHCASVGGARGLKDKDATIQDNVDMVNNLISAKQENVKIILFGSGAMYGKTRPLKKVKEAEIGDFIPEDLYGQSKLEISKIVKKRDDILMLNIFACYGYEEKESRFPSYAINQVLNEEDIIINQNVVFDYLFIEDLQKIVEFFLNNKPNAKIINVTPTNSISLLEIAEIVNSFVEKKVDIKILNSQMNNEYTGDNNILLDNIPGLKFTPIEKGLKKLYDYKLKAK